MQTPASFEYERATSVEHALTLLRDLGPESRILAGGHSLLPMMKLRLATPDYLIDIDDLAGELGYIRRQAPSRSSPEEIRIGAMTTIAALIDGTDDLLTRFAEHVADGEVRRTATVGGNLCASPGIGSQRGDLGAPLIALGARVRSPDRGGARR